MKENMKKKEKKKKKERTSCLLKMFTRVGVIIVTIVMCIMF